MLSYLRSDQKDSRTWEEVFHVCGCEWLNKTGPGGSSRLQISEQNVRIKKKSCTRVLSLQAYMLYIDSTPFLLFYFL